MAFYTRDDPVAQTRIAAAQRNADRLNSDRDVTSVMRGTFTGKAADFAAQLPKTWAPTTLRDVVARQVARDKNIDTSGVRWTGTKWEPSDSGVPLGLELAPYIMGGVAGGLALTAPAAGAGGGAEAGGWGSTEFLGPAAEGAGAGGGGAAAAAGAGGVGIGETGATVGTNLGPAGLTSYPSIATGANAGPVLGSAGHGAGITDLLAGAGGGGGGGGGGGTGGVASWLTGQKGALVGTLASVFGGIYAANKQAGASEEALKQQQEQFDEALKVAKEQQDYERATAAEALAYNRNQYGDYLGRLAPYQQTGLAANASLADFMSRPGANPPGSTAFADMFAQRPPSSSSSSSSSGGSSSSGAAGALPKIAGGDISKQVADYFASQGVTPDPSSVNYWTQKWSEFGAKDPEYFNRRLSQADEFTRGGARSAPTPAAQAPPTPVPGSAMDSLVRLRAPDGTEQDVPASQVQHYLDLGATRIGNRYTTMGAP